mgnify:CR=1 FL=1
MLVPDHFYKLMKEVVKIKCYFIWFQVHPWFKGVDWDRIYQMEAAFIPEVNDELDTQNFEKFDEVLLLDVVIFSELVMSLTLLSLCL